MVKGNAVILPLISIAVVLPVASDPPEPKSIVPDTAVEEGGGEEELVVVLVVEVVVVVVVGLVFDEITPPVPVVVPPDPEQGFQVVTTQPLLEPLEEVLELVVVLLLDVVALDAVWVVPVTLIKQSEPDAPALRHAAESPMIIRYSAA